MMPTLTPSVQFLMISLYLLGEGLQVLMILDSKMLRKSLRISGWVREWAVSLFFWWSSLYFDPFSFSLLVVSWYYQVYFLVNLTAASISLLDPSRSLTLAICLAQVQKEMMHSEQLEKSGQKAILSKRRFSMQALVIFSIFLRNSSSTTVSSVLSSLVKVDLSSRYLMQLMPSLNILLISTTQNSLQPEGSPFFSFFSLSTSSMVRLNFALSCRNPSSTLRSSAEIELSHSSMYVQAYPIFSSTFPTSQLRLLMNSRASLYLRIFSAKCPVKQELVLQRCSLLMILACSYTYAISFVPRYSGISMLMSPPTMNLQRFQSTKSCLSRLSSSFLRMRALAREPSSTRTTTGMMRILRSACTPSWKSSLGGRHTVSRLIAAVLQGPLQSPIGERKQVQALALLIIMLSSEPISLEPQSAWLNPSPLRFIADQVASPSHNRKAALVAEVVWTIRQVLVRASGMNEPELAISCRSLAISRWRQGMEVIFWSVKGWQRERQVRFEWDYSLTAAIEFSEGLDWQVCIMSGQNEPQAGADREEQSGQYLAGQAKQIEELGARKRLVMLATVPPCSAHLINASCLEYWLQMVLTSGVSWSYSQAPAANHMDCWATYWAGAVLFVAAWASSQAELISIAQFIEKVLYYVIFKPRRGEMKLRYLAIIFWTALAWVRVRARLIFWTGVILREAQAEPMRGWVRLAIWRGVTMRTASMAMKGMRRKSSHRNYFLYCISQALQASIIIITSLIKPTNSPPASKPHPHPAHLPTPLFVANWRQLALWGRLCLIFKKLFIRQIFGEQGVPQFYSKIGSRKQSQPWAREAWGRGWGAVVASRWKRRSRARVFPR